MSLLVLAKIVWWKCNKCKYEWETNISARNRGNGCACCDGRIPTKENNLLIINPELCKEWNYDKNDKMPEAYCFSSNDKVWWKCEKRS